MLEVVRLEDGRYLVRNAWTGLPCNHRGKPCIYYTKKRAFRKMNKIANQFNKTVHDVLKGK